jgi:hypothetical protein
LDLFRFPSRFLFETFLCFVEKVRKLGS